MDFKDIIYTLFGIKKIIKLTENEAYQRYKGTEQNNMQVTDMKFWMNTHFDIVAYKDLKDKHINVTHLWTRFSVSLKVFQADKKKLYQAS